MLANILRSQSRIAISACRASTVLRVAARPALSRTTTLSHLQLPQTPRFNSTNASFKGAHPEQPLFVAKIPTDADKSAITDAFSKFGNVKRVRLMRSKGVSLGYAYVEFNDIQDAIKARQANNEKPLVINDSKIIVAYAHEKVARPTPTSRIINAKGIPSGTTEEDVHALFSKFGPISRVQITPLEGRHGYALIEFRNIEDVSKVLEARVAAPISIFGQRLAINVPKSLTF